MSWLKEASFRISRLSPTKSSSVDCNFTLKTLSNHAPSLYSHPSMRPTGPTDSQQHSVGGPCSSNFKCRREIARKIAINDRLIIIKHGPSHRTIPTRTGPGWVAVIALFCSLCSPIHPEENLMEFNRLFSVPRARSGGPWNAVGTAGWK